MTKVTWPWLHKRPNLADVCHDDLASLRLPGGYLRARRCAELILVLLFAPLVCLACLLICLAIRLDSRGPVFFVQDRPGKDGRPFHLVKFRSMKMEPGFNRTLTARGDTRVTRVGRFLRRHRLDELPQLWNVLRGEMSLIGPRPEPAFISSECEKLMPLYRYRQCVLPGLTGLAQVSQGYTDDLEQSRSKLAYDLCYILSISASMDIRILVQTFSTVLTGSGSR